jgi:hypothetical protein
MLSPPVADAISSSAGSFNVECSVFGRLFGSPTALARDGVGGVPPRPVVLRSGRFVVAVALFRFSQKLG